MARTSDHTSDDILHTDEKSNAKEFHGCLTGVCCACVLMISADAGDMRRSDIECALVWPCHFCDLLLGSAMTWRVYDTADGGACMGGMEWGVCMGGVGCVYG